MANYPEDLSGGYSGGAAIQTLDSSGSLYTSTIGTVDTIPLKENGFTDYWESLGLRSVAMPLIDSKDRTKRAFEMAVGMFEKGMLAVKTIDDFIMVVQEISEALDVTK